MGVRGIAAGLTDRVAPIAVTVIADAIQLIPLSNVSGFQGSAGTANIIVNRGGYSGPIVLTAEGLPAGVTASFQPVSGSTSTTTAALDIGPTVAPGVYTVTVRATGTGVPDATAQITLTVTPTVLALSLTPPGVSLLQGTTATTTLTITRTAINRAVVVSVEGAPSGLTITPVPANTAGTTSTISIAAAATLAAGQYDVTVRGTPEGLPISTSVTTTLSVTVRATATGVGNVLLDWSTCTAPSWVAAQDGTGSWTQVTGVSGVFSFTVSSGKGGYAFAEEGNSTTVRYLTQPELTGAPIDMCVTAFGPKTINGVATHGSGTGTVAEQWTYMLGGGSGASTGAGPSFAITGVRNGVHDFIAWGNTQTLGLRGLIRRDQDLPNGASLGTINLVGPESFQALQRSLNVTAIAANEQYAFTVSYLTTPSCTVNLLSSAGAISANFFMYGIPDAQQRSTDFHQVTVTTTSASGSRSASEVFHTMAARTVALPQALPLPSVVAQSGSYKRLQATIPSILAQFNGAVTLRYTDGAKSMSVSATIGYAGSTGVVLSMPDLSGVSGWPSSFAVPTDGRGTWRVTVDGLNANVPLCTENRRAISAWQTGTF
jgi:hypothetical protein